MNLQFLEAMTEDNGVTSAFLFTSLTILLNAKAMFVAVLIIWTN